MLIQISLLSRNSQAIAFQVDWKFGSKKQKSVCSMSLRPDGFQPRGDKFNVRHSMPWGPEWGPLCAGTIAGFFGEAGTITATIKNGREVIASGQFEAVELLEIAAHSLNDTRQSVKLDYQIAPKYSAEEKAAIIARVLAA